MALGVEDDRPAVEHQLVLAAHLIDVDHVHRSVSGPGGQHRFPIGLLASVKRAPVEIEHHLSPTTGQLGDGPSGAPGVFADRHPELDSMELHQRQRLLPAGEVALLVEHRVVGQQTLVIAEHHLTLKTQGSPVEQISVEVDEANHRGAAAGAGRDRMQYLQIVFHEPGLEDQILGRVSGHRQLGEHRDIGPGLLGPFQKLDHAGQVALQVANRGIELTAGHP